MFMSIKKITYRLIAASLAMSMLLLSACSAKQPSEDDRSETTTENTAVTTSPISSTPPKATEIEATPSLTVSELMARNTAGIKDESGKHTAWIELHNLTDEQLSLSDYALEYNGKKFTLPDTTLEGGGYWLLYANGKGEGNNCSFTLGSSGKLILWHGEKIACYLDYVNRNINYSFIADTGAESAQPTPGYAEVKAADRLLISELVSNNSVTPLDGALCDYVELYNDGSEPLDLSKYYVSEKADDLYDVSLPEVTIEPGEYLVLLCDKDLPFGLSKDGGSLYFTRNDGVLAASVTYGAMSGGQVYTFDRGIIEEASPGYPNTYEGMNAEICARSGLVINEVVSSNGSYLIRNNQAYDIVELWNNSDSAVELSDYYFSDSKSELQRYRLPEMTLEAGKHYAFLCTGGAKLEGTAPISLSADGEKVFLSTTDGRVVDALNLPAMPYNVSYGRGSDALYYYEMPTPNRSNGSRGSTAIADAPKPSLEPGVYIGAQTLTLSGEGKIYYTTDGSRPTTASALYQGETITLSATGSVRTFQVVEGKITSPVAAYSYLIDLPDYTLPVMKLSVKDADLFGEKGIYTNFNSRAEKECSASFFVDGEEQFSLNCGIEVFGAYSRQFEKKSLQLKFKAKYGSSKLKYKLFDELETDEFDSVILRSGSQAMMTYRGFINDELVTSLAASSGEMTEVLTQAYRPCNLYINDEYYGLYFIREKISDDFVATHRNVSPESVTIVQFPKMLRYGSGLQDWNALYDYVSSTDLSNEEAYRKVADQICLESLVDVYIMRMWASDRDSGNIRAYRSTEDDGKWRFILFDLDISFEPPVINGSAKYLFASQNNAPTHAIIRSLMKNSEFRALFLARMDLHFANTVSNEQVLTRIDEIVAEIEHDMQYNVVRWPEYHSSVSEWLVKVDIIRSYAVPDYFDNLKRQCITVLGLTADEVRAYFGEAYVQYCV